MTACLSCYWRRVLPHLDSGMRRNQNFWIFGFFLPFLFLLKFFSYCCSDWPSTGLACGQKTSKKASSRRAIFIMEQPGVMAGNFGMSFSLNFLSIFVHISGSIRPITLIWVSLERSLISCRSWVYRRWCQFGPKVMTSEVEERPRLVTSSYGRHRSQWVKDLLVFSNYTLWTFLHQSLNYTCSNIK